MHFMNILCSNRKFYWCRFFFVLLNLLFFFISAVYYSFAFRCRSLLFVSMYSYFAIDFNRNERKRRKQNTQRIDKIKLKMLWNEMSRKKIKAPRQQQIDNIIQQTNTQITKWNDQTTGTSYGNQMLI